jgi:protoporphyrinogen oxidase
LGESNFLLIEGADAPGGLSRSFRDEAGFLWDFGVHIQFTQFEYFRRLTKELIPPADWQTHRRSAWVVTEGRLVPYPLQANIRHLPRESAWCCLKGLIERPSKAANDEENFEEWSIRTFGRGLADLFMLPYNRKVWSTSPKQMSHQWVSERIAIPKLERVLEDLVLERDDSSWGPNRTFSYPKRGGSGAIWNALAKAINEKNIQFNFRLVRLEASRQVARLSDGREIKFDHCLSTIPLDQLVALTEDADESLRDDSRRLRYASVTVVGLGIEGRCPSHLQDKMWLYFPDPGLSFYRVTILSNLSEDCVPQPGEQWSVLAEASSPPNDLRPIDPSRVIHDLQSIGILSHSPRIVSQWVRRAEHGYPVPFLGRDEILQRIHGWYQHRGIFPRGRFGGWKYEVSNQDHSLMQGVEWADRIISCQPETVYSFHKPPETP